GKSGQRDAVEEVCGRARQTGQRELRQADGDEEGDGDVCETARRAAFHVREEREENERRAVEEVALERSVRLRARDEGGLCEEDERCSGDQRTDPALEPAAPSGEHVGEA